MAEQVTRWLGRDDALFETEEEANVSFQLVELERKLYDNAAHSVADAHRCASYLYETFRAAGRVQLLFEVMDCRVPE